MCRSPPFIVIDFVCAAGPVVRLVRNPLLLSAAFKCLDHQRVFFRFLDSGRFKLTRRCRLHRICGDMKEFHVPGVSIGNSSSSGPP